MAILMLAGLSTPPADASWLARMLAKARRAAEGEKSTIQPKLAGQETKAFVLRKAKAEDLKMTVFNFINGIDKQGGSVQVRTSDNALIVTAFPEAMNRLAPLIADVDKPYDHPNADARQMLANQAFLAAIRKRGGSDYTALVSRPAAAPVGGAAAAPAPGAPAGVVPVSEPLVPGMALLSEDELEVRRQPKSRWVVSPTLQQFEVVGWVKDTDGYTVVLNNQGARFVYKNGSLRHGYSNRADKVKGISGLIQGKDLILRDAMGQVKLPMMKWKDVP